MVLPEEASEEDRDRVEAQNEEIERSNELFEKLKQFVQLEIPQPIPPTEEGQEPTMPPPIDYAAFDEKCLVRVMNYRDSAVQDLEAAAHVSAISRNDPSRASAQAAELEHNSQADNQSETSSQRAQRLIEAFELEKLSQKVIMLRPANEGYEGNVMVQHSEAAFMIRK